MFTLPVKQFLTYESCPPEWLPYDLYLFRDETVVFYVGQSEVAFARVWRHLHDGFKGRSLVGKFIRVNWPRSMNFGIEFYASYEGRFADLHYDRSAAEAHLIEQTKPCFNATLNHTPTPLPLLYQPPTAAVRSPRSIAHMMRTATIAMRHVTNRMTW